jgi:murein DD-endopeptidase MepM/ murein hydrolase activator NlpD
MSPFRSLILALMAITVAWSGPASPAEQRLILEGSFVQGGLVVGHVPPGSAVSVDGQPVRVSGDGVFLTGFHRDAPERSELRVRYPEGKQERRVLTIDRRKYQIQRIDGLPPKQVTPSKKDLERIRREAAMARKARERDDPRTDFLTGFIWPLEGRISGVYGSQRVLNGQPRRPHYGVDIAAPRGTPARAPADGIVTLAYPDMYFSGGTLIMDHGHGLSSSFLHLSRILVKEGQRVRQGEIVAEVGATGRVTGPHLDWRMNLFDKRLDPSLLTGPMPAATAAGAGTGAGS